jgi:hypothetical protein
MDDELKWVWKEAVVDYFKVLFRYSHGGTEQNHEKPQSGQSVFLPRFEPDTSRM